MNSVSVMQPYFFPYIGYFQMVDAVDWFVFLDDVQYIERGWSNRNQILNQGSAQMITFPVRKDSRDLHYRDREYCMDQGERAVLRPLRYQYQRAPQFGVVMPLIESIMAFHSANVAEFNANLIKEISNFLGIKANFAFSSDLVVDPSLRAQDKIIAICTDLGADRYVNASGGMHLYDRRSFEATGMELYFMAADLQPYPQFAGKPVVGLSIIDVLMFNSVETIRGALWRYRLTRPAASP